MDPMCARRSATRWRRAEPGAVNRIVARPNVDKRLRTLGYEPYVGAFADAGGFLKRQIDTWGNLIRATGISAD